MTKIGKKYKLALSKAPTKALPLMEAAQSLADISFTKFDPSVEVVLNLGVDPRHADQNVRGAVVLPHGIGKTIRVLVFAKGAKLTEAEEAGADYVGSDDMFQKIQSGWLDFEAVVATPDMMGLVGRLGKILAPKGLMPNPKVGTVTMDVKNAIREAKAGRVEFKVNKAGIVQASVGKLSFGPDKVMDNAKAFIDAVVRAKPPAAKGNYLKSIYVCSTMSPSVAVDLAQFK